MNKGFQQILRFLILAMLVLSCTALSADHHLPKADDAPEAITAQGGAPEKATDTMRFLGKSTGHFVNPRGEANMQTTGEDTHNFTWGKKTYGGKTNTVKFEGIGFVTHPDEVFTVGKLIYYNGDTKIGTNATSVDLVIALEFENGSIANFAVPMGLISTVNDKSRIDNADILRIPHSQFNNVVNIGGKSYMVELSFGEATDGHTTVDQFHVFEGFEASAELLARIRVHRFKNPGGSGSPLNKQNIYTTPALPQANKTNIVPFNLPKPSFLTTQKPGKPIGLGAAPVNTSRQAAFLSDGAFNVVHAVGVFIPTESGRIYQTQVSTDGVNWTNWGSAIRGTGQEAQIYKPIDGATIPRYRVKVTRSN